MIQPDELKTDRPMEAGDAVITTTSRVWEILMASYNGDMQKVEDLVKECPSLIYAQYNYTPPIHFAVREGHVELVKYLLDRGAHDPAYKFYPFQESLQSVAEDRGYPEILELLDSYANSPAKHKYKGDNGSIDYNRSPLQTEFEKVVHENDLTRTAEILQQQPEFALDQTYFWGEGILTMPAKKNRRDMVDLLMSYGAKVPPVLKWTQFYYFELYEGANYMMEKGMNPNTMSWQQVTILHDMAQKGFIDKAALLLKYGADLNVVDEAYLSTPLGLAARWGRKPMVEFLIKQNADLNKSGAAWSTPLAWAMKEGHEEIETILRMAGAQ